MLAVVVRYRGDLHTVARRWIDPRGLVSGQVERREAPAVAFRFAGEPDREDVVDLVNAAYRGESGRKGWTTEADLLDGQRTDLEMVDDVLGRQDSRILLAEMDDRLVGCAHVERRGRAAYFGMFSIRPLAQRLGVGGALLSEAEHVVASAWGCSRLELTVISARNELIAWYRRRGYRPTGRLWPFPYGDERFGVPRRPDLEFAELAKELGE